MGVRVVDPVRVGGAECDAWVAYYRRDWPRVLTSAVVLVRAGFGMSWPRSVLGAWYVLRANRAWAPYPDNDPDAARSWMQRFYRLAAATRPWIDPQRAAALDVEWWRVHRAHQRTDDLSEDDLVAALADLYEHVHGARRADVLDAARHRMVAMRHSDAWNRAGARTDDPLLARQRDALVACYRALRATRSDARPQPSSSST